MAFRRIVTTFGAVALLSAAAGCGNWGDSLGNPRPGPPPTEELRDEASGSTLSELFLNRADPNTTVEVNKYLWRASLEVLNFLPIETVDPFSGVIVTGFGVPPGGGTAYRATILIQDPALDARSLKVALGEVKLDTAGEYPPPRSGT